MNDTQKAGGFPLKLDAVGLGALDVVGLGALDVVGLGGLYVIIASVLPQWVLYPLCTRSQAA